MTRFTLPLAVLVVAISMWLSAGTLAVATPDGPRIALLPVSALSFGVVAFAAAVVVVLLRAGASRAPLGLLALIIIPWLPPPVPPAFLMWSGSIRWLVWTCLILLLVATAPGVRSLLCSVSRGFAPQTSAAFRNRPRLCAGLLAFVIFAWAAWEVSPSVPGGDEPHYLIIAQSLLLDHDLKIENNHRRGDYQAYFAGPLAPHYIQRGRDGEIYSIHAPGLSVLVAPAFALGGYRGVVLFLLIVAACGSALTWHLAWLAAWRPSAAWFGWAAVTLSATAIFHSFTIYPDGVGGVAALTGVWALMRARQERESGADRVLPWLLHGTALALLPWLHSRFAILAGSLGALVLLRLSTTRNPAGKAVAFLTVPALSALSWIGFFVAIYGVPDPSAPYGTSRDFSISFVPGGLAGLLFDQRFGIFANAPVLVCAAAGLFMMLRTRRDPDPVGLADSRLALELLFVLVSYLLTATSYAMWWAGWSAPARLADPTVPALAIPCAVAWSRMRHRAARVIAAGSLALTAFVSFVLVTIDGGRLAYNTRDALALWLAWASSLTALGDGMPVWFRGREGPFLRDVVVWVVFLLLAWYCTRFIERLPSLRLRGPFATAVAGIFAVAAMVALTLVWSLHGVDGVTAAPAQLEFLRRLATEPGTVALEITPPRLVQKESILTMLRIESAPRIDSGGGMGRNEQPLITLPTIPAGSYRVRGRARGPGGWLLLGVGQDQFSLRSEPLPWPASPIEIRLPVDVRALVIRGDEEARRVVRSVTVEPLSLVPLDQRLTDLPARHAVKYSGAFLYFLDERSFPEPDAFWVGGARQSSFVIQPERAVAGVDILLRNSPVENVVSLESGRWRESLTMAPGEERHITIPIAPGHGGALVTVTSRSGFRPSDVVPDSRDERYLGVWMQPLD
jgi:hypothetical protein